MLQPVEQFVTEITEEELGKQLHHALAQVSREGERLLVRLSPAEAVVVVPLDDLRSIQSMENELDIQAAREVLAEMERTGEKPMSLDDYIKSIGEDI